MEYKKMGLAYYIRMDKGDEIISSILKLCREENILSATYNGIGGCQNARIQTFHPQKGEFETTEIEGMLELVSFTGNIISDEEGNRFHHTHALFAYVEDGEHKTIGGHLKSTTVLYTAEIELRPVTDGSIGKITDPVTGTAFWKLS